MLRVLAILSAFALSGCAYQAASTVEATGTDVGGTGGISYNHEKLNKNKHMLIVSAAPGLMETEGSIAQRILVFANRFAAETCIDQYEFVHDPNFSQSPSKGFMSRTRSFVFLCTS